MRYECYFCHIKTIEKLIEKFQPEPPVVEEFIFKIHALLAENRDTANPYLATDIHRIASKYLNNDNLYQSEKHHANEVLLNEYAYWKKLVLESSNPFHTAAKLAVVGNIIDYGAHKVAGDISKQIKACAEETLKINQTDELQKEISKADSILYLGDNAGEIVFDKLFIETINHPDITFAVRGKHVINDVTYEDAYQLGLDSYCRIISNGYDAPSTLLEFCSDEFIQVFDNADLIISKGQGNFEGLLDSRHSNIFFMLMAKCKPMAELLGVDPGDMVVWNGKTANHQAVQSVKNSSLKA